MMKLTCNITHPIDSKAAPCYTTRLELLKDSTMPRPISDAKRKLIDFIRATANEDNAQFAFTIHGDEKQAAKFVHRMRVELSRMRDVIRQQGRIPKPWKMMFVSAVANPLEGTVTITLQKSFRHRVEHEAIREIFDELDGGAQI